MQAFYAAGEGGGGGEEGGGAVGLGWVRAESEGSVEIVVAGAGLAVGGTGEPMVPLRLPVGARGQSLSGGLASVLGRLPYWCRIVGRHDALLVRQPEERRFRRTSLEDGLLAVWDQPFGWVVLAEPVADGVLEEMTAQVALEQRGAQARGEKSPAYAVETERLRERYRELAQAQSTGLWRIHLLAGGVSAGDARRVAGLVCASMDVADLSYTLKPAPAAQGVSHVIENGVDGSSFTAGTEMVAALACPPEQELAGVRFVLSPRFDISPEDGEGGLGLGVVLDRQRRPAGALTLPARILNRHTFVCGATGGGKSNTIRGLLESATAQGLPWLVVEPAKAEYAAMAARLPGHEVIVIRPGDVDAVAAGLNPLEPAVGPDGRRFPLQTHADLLRALFIAAFAAEEPFPQVLSAALTRCYEELGWDLALGEPRTPAVQPRYPTLEDLQRTAERVVADIGYGREITDNVRGFIRVRLASLRLGVTGRFLQGGHGIDFERLLHRNVVFEIEDVGDDHDKAFFMGTVLLRLAEHLRVSRAGSRSLRHLTVIEEAHRLLRRSEGQQGAAAHAVEMFASLLAEIRAYGEGLVIAEQIPAKLVPDVIKNTAVKIVHQLPAADDREAVGATMNLTDAQSAYLVTLPPGEAAVFTSGMDFPLLARMPDGSGREQSPARTASAARIVDPRSRTCPRECAQAPCTLRQMASARRVLEDDPRLAVWAELSVLGHLVGEHMPIPGRALLKDLRGMEERSRDCALAHAVDGAAVARSAMIARTVSPAELAEHVCEAMRGRVAGQWVCAKDEPRWRVARPAELTLGGEGAPAVEAAIGGAGGERDQALAAVLDDFLGCRWPLRLLADSPA